MRILRYLLAVSVLAIVVASCRKIESLPDTPHIEFRSFDIFDTTDILGNNYKGGRLKIYFEDGDGDLGLYAPQSENDDTVNMFLTLYRKSGNIFLPAPENDPLRPSDYRIPYMERNGQNKILKGIISVTFMYISYEPENRDTVKYEVSIKDRSQNFSETISTAGISLSDNGTYI